MAPSRRAKNHGTRRRSRPPAAAAAVLLLQIVGCLGAPLTAPFRDPDAARSAAYGRPDAPASAQEDLDVLRLGFEPQGNRRLLAPGKLGPGSANEIVVIQELLTTASKGDINAMTQLIAAGADVDAVDSEGNTPLIAASENGQVGAVRLLLDSGADIDKPGQHGHTALIVAAILGEVKVLRFLTEVGADIGAVNDDGDTALIIAVREGNFESVQVLLDAGAKVDALDKKRWTPLTHAANSGMERIAELLIKYGADVNARTASTSTPLHKAAAHGSVKIIQMLGDAGADIEAKAFSNGNTPLLTAAWNGQDKAVGELIRLGADKDVYARKYLGVLHRAAQFPNNLQVLQTLLKAGVYINTPSEFGSTPANEAARYGNLVNAEFLLEKGADPSLNGVPICGCMDVEPDSEDRRCPPGHCTKSDIDALRKLFDDKGGNRTIQDAVAAGDLPEVKAFIQRGADVNGAESYSEPPLHIAAARGLVEIIEVLLAEGADADARDISGWTPLTLAASLGHWAAIQALHEGGADLDAEDESRHTALMHACIEGRLRSVGVLIEAGADVDLPSHTSGQTALHKACRFGHVEVVRALLEAGAGALVADDDGRTPLHFAAMRVGTEAIMQMLIDEGGSVNSTTHHGAPPIEFAAFYGNVGGVKFLLSKGADPSIGFQDGSSTDDVCGCLELADNASKIRCPLDAACQTDDQIAEIEALTGHKRAPGAQPGVDRNVPQFEADSEACESLPVLLQRLECAASADPSR